jgi:hypothetical protein
METSIHSTIESQLNAMKYLANKNPLMYQIRLRDGTWTLYEIFRLIRDIGSSIELITVHQVKTGEHNETIRSDLQQG